MNQSLNQAVSLLADLVALSKPSAADTIRIDTTVQGLMPDALDGLDSAIDELAVEAVAAAQAAVDNQAAADAAALAELEAAAQLLVQDDEDEQQRKERLEAGVS